MNNDHTAFPVQKLALRDKTQKWKETCVDAIIAREDSAFYGRDNRKSEMLTNYGLYNSEYDENDLKYVTDPFKVDDGFPARTQDFNIIRSKIDLLIGEESKRPSTTKVVQTNPEVVTQLQEKKKQLLLQYLNLFISGGEQQTDENGQPMTPPEIEEYMRKKYRTVAEDTARHALTYYKEQLNIKNEFLKGFKDALIGAEEIYYVGVRNGNPFAERVNPVCFDYDKDPDLEFIEDGDWCLRRMDMSPAMIYDRFYDKLTPSDLDKILEYANDRSDLTNAGQGTINSTSIMYKERFSNKFFNGDWSGSDGDTIAVYHCCWRSYKKVGFLTITDPETGEVSEVMVDESYKKQEGDILKWDWLPEIWEGYRCGDENAIYFGIGPVEYQHVSVNDPSNRKLPYVGAIYSNTNSTPKSLVKIMKPYQYMYIILWYRLEVALARDKGKVLNMDITQIPKGLGISVEQWMHYLSAIGVNFINPYDEGFNIPGREGGRCFAPGTKVLMANGYIKNIEDISIGDEVMGPDGSPRKVLELHNGIDEMYRIKPASGSDEQIVNSRHEIYYGLKNHHTGEVQFKTSTPGELYDKFKKTPSCRDKYFLYRANNIKFKETEIDFDPYFLGLWLGDGNSHKPQITTMDPEIMEYLEDFAEHHNMKTRYEYLREDAAVNINLALTDKSKRAYRNKLENYVTQNLKELGVYKNKHIPEKYMYASEEDRLQLLAGLIDSDGWYDKKKKRFGFSQVGYRKHIADKVLFIARSLGMKASMRKKIVKPSKKCNNVYGEAYVVSILSGCERIPTKIKRKQAIGNKVWQKDLNRTMFSIEPVGLGRYYGFSTDGDHLFLLGDFTIVHNSATFNQITSVDLTMSNVIAEYINLMAKIEELVGEICGVTKQRQGAIQTNELVGNVERSVIQSSHTTEPLFWLHNQVKKNVYTMLIDVAKYCARNTDHPTIHFIQKDGDRIFLELNDDFLYSDYGIFIGDSSKEETDINSLKSLLQYSLGAGGSLNEAAEIIVSDNVSEIKEKLAAIEARKQQMEQQQLEIQQQQVQQLQEAAQLEAQLKQEELRIKEEDSIRKAETDIQVATINAAAKQYNMQGTDGDGVLDQVETELAIKKAQQEQIKLSAEIEAKKKELEIKQNELGLKQQALEEQKRKDKKAEEQKNEELAIKRKQASRPVSTNK